MILALFTLSDKPLNLKSSFNARPFTEAHHGALQLFAEIASGTMSCGIVPAMIATDQNQAAAECGRNIERTMRLLSHHYEVWSSRFSYRSHLIFFMFLNTFTAYNHNRYTLRKRNLWCNQQ